MKIIEKLDVSSWSHNCQCSNCETKLEIEATDLCHSHSSSDGAHPSSENYYAYCPVCSHPITVAATVVPKIVQIEAQNRSSTRSLSYFDR